MKSDIFKILKIPSYLEIRERKIPEKAFLFLVLSLTIGYLISPKIIFTPTIYKEGDIILQTIYIDEDLLITDKVSTRLKKEQLLKEIRPIYDFDPNVLEITQKNVREAFQTIRAQFNQLDKQVDEIDKKSRSLGIDFFNAVLTQQEIKKQKAYYRNYRAILKSRVKTLQGQGKLTAKDFIRKKKLDADLNTVTHILNDFKGKEKYFRQIQSGFGERFKQVKTENKVLYEGIEEHRKAATRNFDKMLFIELSDSEQKLLAFPYYLQEIETQLLILLSEILNQKIVISKDVFLAEGVSIEIRNLKDGETSNINNFDEFFDIQEARNSVNDVAREYFLSDETGKKKNLIVMLGQKLIKPTVSENKLEYEKRKVDITANMSPMLFSLKKGEIISRAGDRVTGHQVDRINSYFEKASNVDKLPKLAGVVLFVLFSLILISFSFQYPGKAIRLSFRNLFLIMMSVLITLVLVKGGVVVGDIISSRYLEVQPGIYHYILPVAFGAMLVGILLNFEAALMTGLLTSLFSSIMMQGSLYYFFYAMMGSVVASLPMTKFDSRYSILQHGLKISAVNLPMMVIIYLIESSHIGVINWVSITCALFGGILTAILVSIILPFFESIFDITTNLKLLELSNMNHPALKELIFHAPGTYQHSIIVGNLAEAGAVEIGANPLLSRVSAYYHDIGKANESHYYIENQTMGFINIHDSMDPCESAKVIVDHIKKGAEMAEKFRLGKAIIDILLQHHGTNLVKYFYNKAEEQVDESEKNCINEQDFRYIGPKPQSLEAALVMLADVSEASSRSLNKPTPERIREIVEKVCWDILADGQLDESGLTLQTYHSVVDIYCTMLTSIHHHRVAYPDAKP